MLRQLPIALTTLSGCVVLCCLQELFRYGDGMYGLYPTSIGSGALLEFQHGVLLEDGAFWRYTARYHEDRSVDTIKWEQFKAEK